MKNNPALQDRVIALGPGSPPIPERLLLAHARGEVLFICGAGVSMPAQLPDFKLLVLDVYKVLDPPVYNAMAHASATPVDQWQTHCGSLTNAQSAEVRRFVLGDFDVVLGMLERRLDGQVQAGSSVRGQIAEQLRVKSASPAAIHKALIRLADRGGAHTIVTTNFDRLFEVAAQHLKVMVETYSLGGIPRPSRGEQFSGVLHIHGVLEKKPSRPSDLVVSDQDFGEFYLRRRVVPDFIYDAARLFNLVLVGYSANDPPMRYLLNAVAADGSRFDDLKERFTFTSSSDGVILEDWRGRGITPITYDPSQEHKALRTTLERWAELSAINGKPERIATELKRIVTADHANATEAERDLFDHLIRRSNPAERAQFSNLVSKCGADIGWLNAILAVSENDARAQKP
ncbi:MAG: SIR2 family protein [Devosiaceae bacterium]|nr:SIR2 family protein [Devosiaceae bacterium MH13]